MKELAITPTEYLEEIKSCNYLQEEDVEYLYSIKNELLDTMNKAQIWRTETEARVSVLDDVKHPTPASKYWQCVREQNVFFSNLVQLSFDARRNENKMVRIKDALKKSKVEFDKVDLQIDLDECEFSAKNMALQAADRVREIKMWEELKAEQVKLDPNFDTQNVNTHQLESLKQRFKNQSIIAGNSGSPSERANLQGQLATAQRVSQSAAPITREIEEEPEIS